MGARNERRGALGYRDVRLALRGFAKRPAWTFFVLATLTVGIGANIAIFSLIQAVLLRPLRYAEPERLAKIQGLTLATGAPSNISPGEFYDFEEKSQVFESMGAHGWVGFFTVSGGVESAVESERVAGSTVTAGFFQTLGVRPALGRLFTEEDDTPGAPPTAVVTDAFWRTRLDALDPRARRDHPHQRGAARDRGRASRRLHASRAQPGAGASSLHAPAVRSRGPLPELPFHPRRRPASRGPLPRRRPRGARRHRETSRARRAGSEHRKGRLRRRSQGCHRRGVAERTPGALRRRRRGAPHRVREPREPAARSGRRAAEGARDRGGSRRGSRGDRPPAPDGKLASLDGGGNPRVAARGLGPSLSRGARDPARRRDRLRLLGARLSPSSCRP